MAQFKDAEGRSWTISLTVLEIRRVKKDLDLDLLEFASDNLAIIRRLATDPCLLVDVISVVLSDQIATKSLNERQFAEGLVGAGIERAVGALVEALADFFGPRKGAILRNLWAKATAAEQATGNRAIERLEELDLTEMATRAFDLAFDQALQKSGASSSSLPSSPASNRGSSATES